MKPKLLLWSRLSAELLRHGFSGLSDSGLTEAPADWCGTHKVPTLQSPQKYGGSKSDIGRGAQVMPERRKKVRGVIQHSVNG